MWLLNNNATSWSKIWEEAFDGGENSDSNDAPRVFVTWLKFLYDDMWYNHDFRAATREISSSWQRPEATEFKSYYNRCILKRPKCSSHHPSIGFVPSISLSNSFCRVWDDFNVIFCTKYRHHKSFRGGDMIYKTTIETLRVHLWSNLVW